MLCQKHHDDLPFEWMFKQNTIYRRSKRKIIQCARELRLSKVDARKIQQFKARDSDRKDLENLIVSDKMDRM